MNSRLHVSFFIRFYPDRKPNYRTVSLRPKASVCSGFKSRDESKRVGSISLRQHPCLFYWLSVPSKSKKQGKFSRSVFLKMQDLGKCSAFSFFFIEVKSCSYQVGGTVWHFQPSRLFDLPSFSFFDRFFFFFGNRIIISIDSF